MPRSSGHLPTANRAVPETITTVDCNSGEAAESRHKIGIRLPLELIIMTLENVAASSEQRDLMYLRLVNRTFDIQVLKIIFSGRAFKSHMRLLNGTTWRSAPDSLKEGYLSHLLQTRHVNPNVFADLAAPVFEHELGSLCLESNQEEADVHVRLCTLLMHELWNLDWVIAHDRSMYGVHRARVEKHCQFLSGRWKSLSKTGDVAHRRRIEHDRHFLQIALHIMNDHRDIAVQMLFPASFVCPDDLNYCFGTTILGVAVRWGTESLIERVLERTRTTSEQHLDVYLKLAARRCGPDSYAIFSLLLNRFEDIAHSRALFIQRLLFKAIRTTLRADYGGLNDIDMVRKENRTVFNAVLKWVALTPATPGVLEVMEECFRRLKGGNWFSKKTLENLRFLGEAVPCTEKIPTSTPIIMPAFMTGTYYRHAIKREVVRATHMYEVFRFNCLCWAEGEQHNCCCREGHYCSCEMTLQGYCLPNYIYEKPEKLLFEAASVGLLNWVDWLLWAGADPRNLPTCESLLFWAHRGGIKREVTQLLVRHGWELPKLTIFPRRRAEKQEMHVQSSQVRSSVAEECITGEGTEVLPEVWAAGSGRCSSPFMAMFDDCHSNFWNTGY